MTKYAITHNEIKKMIDRMRKETENSKAIVITSLCRRLKMDIRTLNKHLAVMEIDGYVELPKQYSGVLKIVHEFGTNMAVK